MHLTTVTVHLEKAETRVTAVAHIANLAGTRPEDGIAARLRLHLDGNAFRPSETSAEVDEAGHTITWQGRESRGASVAAMDAPLFPGDSTVVLVYRGGRLVDRAVLDGGSGSAILGETSLAFSRRFAALGIHHILSGPDHVLFVVGLALVRGTLRGLLAVITAFTIAHSITLSLTVLGIGGLPPRLVEPLIALSIAAVGAENLACRRLHIERRVWLAFGFGFFHGFGFAGALTGAGLPRDAVAWALAAFNIGVEFGQACIVLAAVVVLRVLDYRSPAATAAVARYASLGIIAAGALWFVERLRA
jgi:hydrogenase/urease accessory protein HupE